jgi:hypothetical protein
MRVFALFLLLLSACDAAPRYTPRIHRSSETRREFQRQYSYPSMGKTAGACPGSRPHDSTRVRLCRFAIEHAMADRRRAERQGQGGAERLRAIARHPSSAPRVGSRSLHVARLAEQGWWCRALLDRAAAQALQRSNTWPPTGRKSDAGPGYAADQVQALKHGGIDEAGNMQWQTWDDLTCSPMPSRADKQLAEDQSAIR